MSAKYKCPFCGHNRIFAVEQEGNDGRYVAECKWCGARGPIDYESWEEAFSAWDEWIEAVDEDKREEWECGR